MRRAIVAEAVEKSSRWPPRFGSNEANSILVSIEGAIQLAAAPIRTGRPDVTLNQALDLAGKLGLEDLDSVIDAAFGRLGATKGDDPAA